MADKVVLGFCIGKSKEESIRILCRNQNVVYKAVSAAGYGKTLGNIAGIKGIQAVGQKPQEKIMIDEEMLVFSGFTSEELDQFLEEYKKKGIERITLKAVITMHNVLWTPEMLFSEIRKERMWQTKK